MVDSDPEWIGRKTWANLTSNLRNDMSEYPTFLSWWNRKVKENDDSDNRN